MTIDINFCKDILELAESRWLIDQLRWSGSDHDDEHYIADWISYIVRQLGQASCAVENAFETDDVLSIGEEDLAKYRKALLGVMSLAISAYASSLRKVGRVD